MDFSLMRAGEDFKFDGISDRVAARRRGGLRRGKVSMKDKLEHFESGLNFLWSVTRPVAVVGESETSAAVICERLTSLGVEAELFEDGAAVLAALHDDPEHWSCAFLVEGCDDDQAAHRSLLTALDSISPSLPVVSLSDSRILQTESRGLANGCEAYEFFRAFALVFDRKVEKISLCSDEAARPKPPARRRNCR